MTAGHAAFALAVVLNASWAHAIDVEYGAESLPVLDAQTNYVLKSVSAERMEVAGGHEAFRVRVDEMLKGPALVKSTIAVISAARVQSAHSLSNALLFLRGPIEPERVRELGLPADLDWFWLVSGELGAVGSDTNRGFSQQEAAEYLRMSDAARIGWARRNLTEGESAQRGALLELGRSEHAKDARALDVIGQALKSDAVSSDNKETALSLLQRSESERASEILKEVASDPATPPSLRTATLQSLSAAPNGEVLLLDLSRNGSEEVKSAASRIIQSQRADAPSVSGKRPARDAVKRGLESPLAEERARAFGDVSKLQEDDALALMRGVFAAATPGGAADRLSAVESVGRFESQQTADLLREVARNRDEAETVRTAAVLAIAGLEAGIASGALNALLAELEDGPVKQLAQGLAAQ